MNTSKLPLFAGACGLLLAFPAFAEGPAAAPAPPPSVILVAMDTTRADHLSAYGYARSTSPNFDRFAREAVLFERCYAQSNETLTSFASTFTSRLPSEIAPLAYDSFHIPADAHTLSSVLQLMGFQTAAFVAGGHLIKEFGHDRGFDVYQDGWNFGSLYHTIPPALAWLDQRDSEQPFFLFIHGYDAHAPYAKPLYFEGLFDPDYAGPADQILGSDSPLDVEKVWQGRYYPDIRSHQVTRTVGEREIQVLHTDLFSLLALQAPSAGQALSEQDLEHFVAHYDGSIAYGDLQLGLLMASLRERGLLDSTLIIVMGDHGEDLFEHGHANHRISLHDASGHVPLLIRLPGGEHGGQRVATPVDLLDIMPTVLDFAGTVAPAQARGHSLAPLLANSDNPDRPPIPMTFSEGILPMASVRSDTHRLILGGALPGSPAFFDLLKSASIDDPAFALFEVGPSGEQRLDLGDATVASIAQPLLDAMRKAYEGHALPYDEAAPYIDPELLQVMRDKGYW